MNSRFFLLIFFTLSFSLGYSQNIIKNGAFKGKSKKTKSFKKSSSKLLNKNSIAIKWPFSDKKIVIRNKSIIKLTTGVCPPVSGSTIWEKPSPVVDAIFSPAKLAAANQIESVKPSDRPISASTIIIMKRFISKIY